MFIYFVEQVWHDDIEKPWSRMNFTTHEASARYWDLYHLTDMSKHAIIYPRPHMELGIDYIEY